MIKIKHKGLKIILLIALFLVIILTTILIIVNNNINSIVSTKLKNDFKNSEYSKYYNLSFNNLHINIITGTIRFSDVEFSPKKDVDTMFFYNNGKYIIKIKDYVLKDADIYKYIETDSINVRLIKVIAPEIEIIKSKKNIKEDVDKNFFISPYIKVKKITVKNAKFLNINNYLSSKNSIENLNVSISNFEYKSSKTQSDIKIGDAKINSKNIKITNTDAKSILVENFKIEILNFALKNKQDSVSYSFDDFIVEANNFNTTTNSKDYKIYLKKINANFNKNIIELTDLKLIPNLTKQQFANKYKFQKEWFNIEINKISIANLNLDSLIYKQSVLAKSINIDNGKIEIYKDKTKPQDLSIFPQLPNLAILKIPYQINIEDINMKNINVLSREKTKNERNGFVDLKINTKIKNVNNIDKTKPLLVAVNGNVHNVMPFYINLSFNYNINGFTYNGKVKSFDLTKLNDIVSSYYPVVIKSGNVKYLKFKGIAKNGISKGNMEFRYNKLKLKLLNNNSKSDIQYYKNNILSFTANTIILSNNPSTKTTPIRDVDFVFERDKNKGIGNYLLKSVFTGISETVMPSKENRKKYSDKRKNEKHKKLPVLKL